jgi:hypothetical protein
MRYCDALTSATGFGYWVFPPIDLQLIWDGEQVYWSFGETEEWLPLSGSPSGAVQFPGFADLFDGFAPPELRGFSPPFLTALPELGGVQIWTGLLARTTPGWSLLVRPPVNLPGIPGLTGWEGLVETDHWFGPLFSNFRITRTDFPVRIRSHAPFLQIQPVPQLAYSETVLNQTSQRTAADMTETDWADLGDVLLPDDDAVRQGGYAVRLRKRRACPRHSEMVRNVVEPPTGS